MPLRYLLSAALFVFGAASSTNAQNAAKLFGNLQTAVQKQDTLGMIEAADAILSQKDSKPAYLPTLMALAAKAGALSALERHALALPVLDRAIAMVPDMLDLRLSRASVYANLRRYDAVLDELDVAEALAKGDEQTLLDIREVRAYYLSEGDQHAAAVDAYTALLDVTDDPVQGIASRGEARYRAGDVEGALADMAEALSRRPDSPLLLLMRVDVLLREDRFEEARADLDLALAQGPAAAGDYLFGIGLVNRGYVRWQMSGDPQAATADIERSIQYFPDNPFAFRARALLRLDAGEVEGACDDLGRAMLNDFYDRFGPHYTYGPDVRALLAEHCTVDSP